MRTIFLLVDVKNLQRGDLGLLSGANFVVKVFVGANQAKIPLRLSRHFSGAPQPHQRAIRARHGL